MIVLTFIFSIVYAVLFAVRNHTEYQRIKAVRNHVVYTGRGSVKIDNLVNIFKIPDYVKYNKLWHFYQGGLQICLALFISILGSIISIEFLGLGLFFLSVFWIVFDSTWGWLEERNLTYIGTTAWLDKLTGKKKITHFVLKFGILLLSLLLLHYKFIIKLF